MGYNLLIPKNIIINSEIERGFKMDTAEMDVFEAIYSRRSTRAFKTENGTPLPVPDEKIEMILESFRWAPSPSNIQPWRIILIKSDEMRHLLAKFGREMARLIFGSSAEVFFGHIWYVPDEMKPKIAEYTQTGMLWEYPKEANFILVPCISRSCWFDSYASPASQDSMWSTCLGMALQNSWLTIHSLGLGGGFNAMPLSDARRREMFSDLMSIPRSWIPAGAFAIGVPEHSRMVGPSRASFEGLVFNEVWGNIRERMAFKGNYEVGEIPQVPLSKAIRERRSIRKYKRQSIPDWKIEKILDVAKWCPNPENLNHFRFIVIRNQEIKDLIASFNKEYYTLKYRMAPYQIIEAHMNSLNVEHDDILGIIKEEQEKGWNYPSECDIIIVPLYTKTAWFEYPGSIAGGIEHIWATATGAGIQNMWLAAHALGLGAAFCVYPLADIRRQEILCDLLGIPRSWEPCGALCLGVPDEVPKVPKKNRISDYVFSEVWGNSYEPTFVKD